MNDVNVKWKKITLTSEENIESLIEEI